jgi:hypothetical protein
MRLTLSPNHQHRLLQRPPWNVLIVLMAFALALIGAVAFVKGVHMAFWGKYETILDLDERYLEVVTFLDGHYPNPGIDPRATRPGLTHSVYPPYAFPLMVPLFAGDRLMVGQLSVIGLSVASLAVMARWAYRQLRFAGRPMAWLGAAAALALNGVPQSLAYLQFSLICTGLLLMQEELLERRRPWAAGLCWALAMLKPQIALPFALLFAWKAQWRGLFGGSGMLLGLSLFCTSWTGISLSRIAQYWLRGKMLDFTSGNLPLLPFRNTLLSRIDPTLLQWALLTILIALMLILSMLLKRWNGRVDMISLTGLCGVVGVLAFYHRAYDYVMLFPALIALFRLALLPQGRAWPWISLLAVANALVLWRPNNLSLPLPLAPLQTLIWTSAGVLLALRLREPGLSLRER